MTAVEIKSLDEQVFEYRNKAYGAYQLRKNQNRNLLIGMIAVYGISALTWGACQAVASFFPEKPTEKVTDWVFPDPDVNPESEPNIEKPTQTGKSPARITNPVTNLFHITDALVLDSTNIVATQTIETGTSEDSDSETGTGTRDGNGKGNSNTGIIGEEESAETQLIQVVEPASFPGGDKMMEAYIKTNFQFPREESTGTLIVYYEIDENGKTKNVRILKSFPGATLFELEAIRVLSNMPDWNPQKINGKSVATRKEIKINCKQ